LLVLTVRQTVMCSVWASKVVVISDILLSCLGWRTVVVS
jgi:hypothetical protein